MWNGTAATLNPNPAMISANPITTPGAISSVNASASAMPSNRVVPRSPKTWLIPKSSRAEDSAPSKMYLVPPSLDFGLYLSSETRT